MAENSPLIRLAGTDPSDTRPRVPFAPEVLDFLADLSKELRGNADARHMGDVQTFAFWCRRANLDRLRTAHDDGTRRLGRGLAFHVAPANVPINFAFSLAFGLLAGCANIVRVPSAPHAVVDLVAQVVGDVLARHSDLAAANTLVRYDAASQHSAEFSARADARILWGGDSTVSALRALASPPRCVDVAFADRTSFCVMDAPSVLGLDAAGLDRLAHGFFNDTYLMDQNACSSPHVVVWLGEGGEAAALRFWGALGRKAATDYPQAPVQAVDKHADLLEAVLDGEPITRARTYGGAVTVLEWSGLPSDLGACRGRFGLFRQWLTASLEPLVPHLDGRFQTLTCFGMDVDALADFVVAHRLSGIDRVVPVGEALDMGLVWDGYDLIGQLSRVVDARTGRP